MADKMLRLTYDGDGCGKKVGRAIIANNEKELHNISAKIDLGHEIVNNWVAQNGGKRISGGGDEGSFKLPKSSAQKVEDLREEYHRATGITISVGIGKNLSEAGRSLLSAKFRGKDQTVWYSPHVERDIETALEKIKTGKASQEEYKLGEAYLEKAESMLCNLHKNHVCELHKSEEGKHAPHTEPNTDDPCPYCADDEDNRTDDCQYCQDLDAEENADGTAGMHDCPACKEYDIANQTTGGIDDCPACQDYDSRSISQATPVEGTPAEQGADNQHRCNCPECPKNDQTGLAVEDMGAEHPDNCPECQEMYSAAAENQPGQTGQSDPNLQGHETAEEVLDLLDQEPGSAGPTPETAAKKIDNTELPQGDQMKDNTSVKENFGPAQASEISDSESAMANQEQQGEDGPDMAGVLQNGLDEHADDQKKQQVLDMVGQTLAGFKANKASLEATKEQNQALYNSCIQMLKSMIALCDLLGLKPSAAPAAPQEQLAPAPEAPPAAASPAPPSAAPAEGAAQDPKARG